jgi:hypothetical protein
VQSSFQQLRDRTREYKPHKEVGESEAGSDVWSALTFIEQQSTSYIVEARNPDERGWAWQRRFQYGQCSKEIAQFNPLCRNNNAEAVPQVAIKSPAQLPHAVITK